MLLSVYVLELLEPGSALLLDSGGGGGSLDPGSAALLDSMGGGGSLDPGSATLLDSGRGGGSLEPGSAALLDSGRGGGRSIPARRHCSIRERCSNWKIPFRCSKTPERNSTPERHWNWIPRPWRNWKIFPLPTKSTRNPLRRGNRRRIHMPTRNRLSKFPS